MNHTKIVRMATLAILTAIVVVLQLMAALSTSARFPFR